MANVIRRVRSIGDIVLHIRLPAQTVAVTEGMDLSVFLPGMTS
jgi:hypothetical protein